MTTIAQLKSEIDRRRQLAEDEAGQGNRREAAYQIGFANGLELRRQAAERSRQVLLWANGKGPRALLWLDGALCLPRLPACRQTGRGQATGRLYLGQRRTGYWCFDLLAGDGKRGVYATVRDGIARRRKTFLGPVFFLEDPTRE